MHGVQKFLAVIAVLAIGVGAALPFRRAEPLTVPAADAVEQRSDPLVRRQHVPLSVSVGTSVSPAVGLDFQEEEQRRLSASLDGAVLATPAIESAESLPALARNYQPVADPLGPAPARLEAGNPALSPSPAPSAAGKLNGLAADRQRYMSLAQPALEKGAAQQRPVGDHQSLVQESSVEEKGNHAPITNARATLTPDSSSGDDERRVALRMLPAVEPVSPEATSPQRNSLQSATPSASWRRHRIVDGDTLPALALRYLGSESRADEIYQANRQRLPSPQVLPLGIEILVPSAELQP